MSSAQSRRPKDVTACAGRRGRRHSQGDACRTRCGWRTQRPPSQEVLGHTHMTCIAFNPVRARVFVHGISKACARQCDHQCPVTEALKNMVNDVVVQHTKSCAAARRQWVSSSGGACICARHAHHLSRFSIFLTFISSSELSGVFRTKTSAPSAPRRPPGAPLTARCCRQAGCMMTRGGQALEQAAVVREAEEQGRA